MLCCCLQVIVPDSDDGWLAEHDPSVCSLNLLAAALRPGLVAEDGVLLDDEFSLPGLLETALLWMVTSPTFKLAAGFSMRLPPKHTVF